MYVVIIDPNRIKEFPVGTRVRVNGIETEITYHFPDIIKFGVTELDTGFETLEPLDDSDRNFDGNGLFASGEWDLPNNRVEVWIEE